MKEGFDREIDSLLRRRARGTAEPRLWGDGAGDGKSGAHLDADELGAFAEGALPAAARLSAASHLADCERCRGVVVGLARVADAVAEVKPLAVAATAATAPARPSAWRAFVASLFAPRVMRLAVPVLALSLVGVVSYLAIRSNRGALQMAKQNRSSANTSSQAPAATAPATESDTSANLSGLIAPNDNAAPRAAQDSPAPSGRTRGHGEAGESSVETETVVASEQPSAAAPAPPPPAATPAGGPADLSKAAPATKTAPAEEGETARADNREKSDSRDRDKEKSARQSEPGDDVASNVASNDVAQRRAANSRAYDQAPDGSRNQQKRAGDNNASQNFGYGVGGAAQPKESDSGRGAARSETAARARAPRQAERKAEDESDEQTRAAAGHRFRRKGNVWVDVNYKDSMSSTGVHRDTENFRALVADVPEVGRVAAALSGEIIVVVGGRAYHIR